MIAPQSALEFPNATAGEIAVLNMESSLQRSWRVLEVWPDRLGTVELIFEMEHLRAQFLGDVTALDRLAALSLDLRRSSPQLASTHLIVAQVCSILHRFSDSKTHLATAEALGAPSIDLRRARLSIKQALGETLACVLESRRELAEASGTLEDIAPLGALLADLGEFDESHETYVKAIQQYKGTSPFALAWVCFQLGVLWGETVPRPDPDCAARWYGLALGYLPAYTHARVHLAEIHLDAGNLEAAEALLMPIANSGDPEAKWRLAELFESQAKYELAELQCQAARSAFETLLQRHELAFADHAAEFYLGAGANPRRACALARVNLANRSTLRAFELAHTAAISSGDNCLASKLVEDARALWGDTKSFASSCLAEHG